MKIRMHKNAVVLLICMVTLAPVTKMCAMDKKNLPQKLFNAIHEDDHAKVALLLKNNASCNHNSDGGYHYSPLIEAAFKGNATTVHLLLNIKADVNHTNNDGGTALHNTAWNDNNNIANLLLTAKANVNHADSHGDTPLHNAAWQGNNAIVSLLLTAKANINHTNKNGNTALHEAARMGNSRIVHLLLAAQADPFQKNNDKKNALQLASYNPGTRNIILSTIVKEMLYTVNARAFCEDETRDIVVKYWNYDVSPKNS